MKIIIKIFLMQIVFCNYIIAQNVYCFDEKGIVTDPRISVNPENPVATNKFHWFPILGDNHDILYIGPTNNLQSIGNPFWSNPTLLNLQNIAFNGESDFYPEDGWELIKVDLGRLADDQTSRNGVSATSPFPYFCLYNKYRGIMRFFGNVASDGYEMIKLKIQLVNNTKKIIQNH